MLIPIGTDIRTPRLPIGNYALIAVNVLVFVFTDLLGDSFREGLGGWLKAYFALDAARPSLHQYLTYQFLHGGILHLAGNMLFLWIFGNAVCDRMGSGSYVLFYLAGGVFAGFAFTLIADNPMVGASGAIAAVTTAFLALFPRVHITILVWVFFIFTFQVPAMILITFKIILWDNIIAPSFDHTAASNVAYSAHLGGYAFGFGVSLGLLAIRALPRNQFDMVALWSRVGRQHGWPRPRAAVRPIGARPIVVEELDSRPLEAVELTPVEQLREEIAARLADREPQAAVAAYLRLLELDNNQVLSSSQQIEVANHLAQSRRYREAAAAYEAFLGAYPGAGDAAEVRLFVGLICSRYLQQYERSVSHLREALEDLKLDAQRTLAEVELRQAEARILGHDSGDN
ncbi:MAG: rhomboid family intramembrane serine protease [Phycisphaerae bacterium]|nr:rhomboid family intramembrane serine protease [Phycisphaerae bacterium]